MHPGAIPLGRRGRTSICPEGCAAIRVEDRVTGRDEVSERGWTVADEFDWLRLRDRTLAIYIYICVCVMLLKLLINVTG